MCIYAHTNTHIRARVNVTPDQYTDKMCVFFIYTQANSPKSYSTHAIYVVHTNISS